MSGSTKHGSRSPIRNGHSSTACSRRNTAATISEVLHAFETRGPKLDVDRIIEYALKLDGATVKRLGWILENQGVTSALLARLLLFPIKGYRVLDSTGPRRGPCDARWMIQLNLPGRMTG